MSDERDNLIDFESAKNDIGNTSLEVRHRDVPFKKRLCRHARVYIYQDDRRLECKDCGAAVDWYAFIMQQADGHRRLRSYEQSIARARKELDALKADEKRTKARLRNARKRLAAIEAKLGPKR